MAVQKDSSCLKTLDLQLSEVDMLISMFPDQEEFKLDDPCAVAEVKSYVEGNMSYDELQSRIGFTLNLHSKSQVPIELVCQLPHEYPDISPEVFTRSPKINRKAHCQLNECLHSYILELEKGEICILSIIQWLQDNEVAKGEKCTSVPTALSKSESSTFTRLWIYSHHIYGKFKRRDLINWAHELNITGFSLPGKPGVICAEGDRDDVQEYWQRVHNLNWKKIAVKDEETSELKKQSINDLRKFPKFEEKAFEARAGRGRECHMDLGRFYEYLEEHGCGRIFSLYYGVEGRTSNKI
ncbi:hypothetical protein ScPMuIL_009863 [Solemya velum]